MADAPSRWLSKGTRFPTFVRGLPASRGWFAESLTRHEYHCHRLRAIRKAVRTPYQACVLADSHSFGRCLILDGEMQSSILDEFIYHESLIHPAMILHREPREVLIMGGGEGASLREVLRHSTVRQAVMADIDGEVLGLCIEHLPHMHQGSFDDPRARVVIDDAQNLIRRSLRRFDVIFSDLPSAIRGGPAYRLYTQGFYRDLKARLKKGGVFALQAGSGQLLQLSFHKALANTLRTVFRVVRPYYVHVPAYDVPWAFLVCTDEPTLDPMRKKAGEINRTLRKRGVQGRFLDGEAFEGLFRVPRYLRQELARERRVIRENRPVYFFV